MTKDQVRQNDREHNAVWPPRGRLPGWYYRALRRRQIRFYDDQRPRGGPIRRWVDKRQAT